MPVFTRPSAQLAPEQQAPTSTFGEAFSASFGETWATGPLGSMGAAEEIEIAETGRTSHERISQGVAGSFGIRPTTFRRPVSPMVSMDDARQRAKDYGVEADIPFAQYPNGMRSDTLDVLIRLNQEKQRRQSLSAGYNGWAPDVAGMLVGSVIDPINVGLAFVPAVGEARYAKLLAQAGDSVLARAAVRTGVGAVEGGVGAAMAEPFIYFGQQQWRNDYDAYDSMLNIAGGAAFGSLLHAGAGMARDAFGRTLAPPAVLDAEIREVQQRMLSAQEPTRVADWMRPMDADRVQVEAALAAGRPADRAMALPLVVERMRADIEADLLARSSAVADPGVVAAAKQDLAAAQHALGQLEGQRRALTQEINARPGVTRKQAEAAANRQLADQRADLEGRVARAQDEIARNKDASDAVAELSALQKRGEVPESWRERVELAADRMVDPDAGAPKVTPDDPFAGVRPFVGALDQKTQAASLRAAIAQALEGRHIDVTPVMLSDPGAGGVAASREAMQRAQANATTVDGARPEASRAADTRLRDGGAETLLEDARAKLADDKARLAARGDDATVEADYTMADAKQQADAAKAVSMCLMRNAA